MFWVCFTIIYISEELEKVFFFFLTYKVLGQRMKRFQMMKKLSLLLKIKKSRRVELGNSICNFTGVVFFQEKLS